jgi:hypothetical protein
MEKTVATEQALMVELRRRRAELRESMGALENALAAPASHDRDRWAQRVHVALVELSADMRAHIDITEGPDGMYADLSQRAPRLSTPIARLTREHATILSLIEDLAAKVEEPEGIRGVSRIRDLGTTLLGTLVRHRQRGSDLVYEAYDVDIGGET